MILRRLAVIDEGFVEDQAGIGLDPAGPSALDPKTAALLRVGLLWPSGHHLYRARAGAGAAEDEIAVCWWPLPQWPDLSASA